MVFFFTILVLISESLIKIKLFQISQKLSKIKIPIIRRVKCNNQI